MNATYQPMTLKKVKGFPDRRQGTIVRTLSDGTEHTVTVVTQKTVNNLPITKHKVYVEVDGESRYAGYVMPHGVGMWDIGQRQYGQTGDPRVSYTDRGTLAHFVETVAHGYLTSRDYHLKGE